MKLRAVLVWSFVVASIAASDTTSAANPPKPGGVREGNPTCFTATAVLTVGDGAEDERRWSQVREVVQSNRRWTVVPAMQPTTVGTVALVQFDVRHQYKGGPTTAYTVQCGHGGTCNEVANAFAARFPTIQPAPIVQCGDVSNMLVNPTPR